MASTNGDEEVGWSEPEWWQNVSAAERKYLDRLSQKTKRVLEELCHDVYHLYPKTPGEFTDVQGHIERLLGEGEVFQALPFQSLMAVWHLFHEGPEDPVFMKALHEVVSNVNQRGHARPLFYEHLLPLAVKHWGIESPETKRLVQQAAMHVYKLGDPRKYPNFTGTVQEIAQQLPDGFGWGSTVVAPVPDEDAFNRHAVMQRKAENLVSKQLEYKLAQEMLQRCVKFYETLGSHWLAVPRNIRCLCFLSECALYLEGPPAGEPPLLKAKRLARRELGTGHELSAACLWNLAVILKAQNRVEQALSLYTKALRLRKEVLGPRHYHVIQNRWVSFCTAHDEQHIGTALDMAQHLIWYST